MFYPQVLAVNRLPFKYTVKPLLFKTKCDILLNVKKLNTAHNDTCSAWHVNLITEYVLLHPSCYMCFFALKIRGENLLCQEINFKEWCMRLSR